MRVGSDVEKPSRHFVNTVQSFCEAVETIGFETFRLSWIGGDRHRFRTCKSAGGEVEKSSEAFRENRKILARLSIRRVSKRSARKEDKRIGGRRGKTQILHSSYVFGLFKITIFQTIRGSETFGTSRRQIFERFTV